MAKKLPIPISKEEFDKLLEEAKKDREKYRRPRKKDLTPRGIRVNQYIIALCLGFGAGMRISEIVGFKDKIHPLQKEQIEINFIRVISGKGGKDRQVPLPTKLFRKAGISRKELIDNLPLKVSRSSIQKYTEYLGKVVLKKKISFHKLRHGFVTFALESGVPIHQVQMFAGHSRLDTTGIYLHANPKQALEKFEEIEW